MEFSMKFLAIMSLSLLVSMSTEMGGPLLANAQCACNPITCDTACNIHGYNRGCCEFSAWYRGFLCVCSNQDICLQRTTMEVKIGEKTMMIEATPKRSFIKEPVD
ncbi:unnamed protein product [Fraxinus pennsylvanica]|uniref:Uncharacterized protein n=1 Tax=Fraxinus pennsylvanica TaxID=56036 RepID=A0AAD2AC21_9LAMI|nr:unnamed protein product [Fraxinus pennsylvanica]